MGVIWDPDKARRLRVERKIEIQEVADSIIAGDYLAILENPGRPGQQVFVVRYRDYTKEPCRPSYGQKLIARRMTIRRLLH